MQWPDYPSPVWRGADIINKQRAQLAINNLKETSQYCQPPVPVFQMEHLQVAHLLQQVLASLLAGLLP